MLPTTLPFSALRAAQDAYGLTDAVGVLSITATPTAVTVVQLRRDDDGRPMVAGDEVATVTTVIPVIPVTPAD